MSIQSSTWIKCSQNIWIIQISRQWIIWHRDMKTIISPRMARYWYLYFVVRQSLNFQCHFFRLKLSFSTYVSLAFILLGLWLIIKLALKDKDNEITVDCRNWLLLLVGWNIVTIIRGAFYANNYWDWKILIFTNAPALLIPSIAFLGYKLYAIKDLLWFYSEVVFYRSIPITYNCRASI